MKGLIAIIIAVFFLTPAYAEPPAHLVADHESMIYPVVRVVEGRGSGSGTVIYSQPDEVGKYETYVLTNHHVIDRAIKITEEWCSTSGKDIKQERRSVVYVEIFQYLHLSVPVGTLKVEADIVAYNKREDMALLKLRSETQVKHVAKLAPRDMRHYVLSTTYAVGCSLSFPPLPTKGMLTRKNFLINSLPYHMSSAQIIYGNSGGAMFNEDGKLIGIPSLGLVIGWGTPITHMGLFIPISRVYDWFEREGYDFLYE